MREHERLAYSVAETAAMLGVSVTLVREQVRAERIPVLRLGRRVLIGRAAVERLIEEAGARRTSW